MKARPFWLPELGHRERDLIASVLDENYLNDGKVTTQFEQRVAELLEVSHGIAVTSGTAAISLALYALGVRPGDEVIVPDVTFVATASAVTMIGATPVLVDVDETTLMLDPDEVSKAVTPRTRAIIPVHVSGRPAPMDELKKIAQEHCIALVEDAAEALMSRYKGQFLGTIGQAGCFSLSPNKTITTGQGGLIVTNDSMLAARLRALKDQGRDVQGTGGADQHNHIGFNFKLTNLQAAVGLGQLDLLPARVARLRAIRREYVEGLSGVEGVRLLPVDEQDGTVPQWIDICVDSRRDELIAFLKSHSMICREFWHPLHHHQPYRQSDTEFPVSTRLVPQACWLPSAFQLESDDIQEICRRVREFFS